MLLCVEVSSNSNGDIRPMRMHRIVTDLHSSRMARASEPDLFRKTIDIGLRTYGDGHAYSESIVETVHQYCREQLSSYLNKHQQLLSKNNQLTFLTTIVYISRHHRARLKRLEQYLHAKERPEQTAQEGEQRMAKHQKTTSNERFRQICRQLRLDLQLNVGIFILP